MNHAEKRSRLRALAAEFDLTYARIADLCRVSLWTVEAWMRPPGTAAAREIPDGSLELLALKAEAERAKKRPKRRRAS